MEQASDLQSGSRTGKKIFNRIRHLSKDWSGNTGHIFKKIRNIRGSTLRFDSSTAEGRLTEISAALESASEGVEPKFMELGEELQAVFFDATGLTDQISEKVKLFGEDSDESLLAKVRRRVENCLEELRDFRTEVSKKTDHINKLVDYLGHLHKRCDAFEQTTMFIRVVGLNVGVESTRSAECREMFSVVAEEIKKVSEKITDITKTILKDSKTEQARQVATSGGISEGMNHLDILAQDGENAVRQAVRHIEQLIRISIETLEDAGTHTEEISRQVGEIVQGIQFHDNMNQRIEHITNALEDVKKLCDRGGETAEPGGTKAERFGRAYAILEIQEAQLERVISEVDLVHQKTHEAFEKIKSKVSGLAESLPSFDSNGGSGRPEGNSSSEDPVSALKSALDQLQTIQGKGRRLVERITETTSHASETVANLSDHTKRVRRISLDTHIMALNAIVKAAHLGENGRTQEVLAQEIRSLSKRSDAFVEDVESNIEQINLSAKDLTGVRIEEEEKGFTDIAPAESLDKEVEELTRAYASFLEDSAVIIQRAEALQAAITRAGNGLDFISLLAQELGDHLTAVSDVRKMFSPWATAGHGGSQDEASMLAERYTMVEEREIHERALGIKDDEVELFGEYQHGDNPELTPEDLTEPVESAPNAGDDEGDLGDNVELF